MGLGHSHHHGHGSHAAHHHGHHAGPGHGRAFAIAITLNLGFVVAEIVAGLWSGSVALLADAGHNLGDVLSLVIAWGASVLAARPARTGYTWGFRSSSILAALANAALLWLALGMILLETVQRLTDPAPVAGWTMIAVAALGIAINGLSALLFAKGSKRDLNLRAAFQHLLADALVSAGVVLAGAAILLTGLNWVDPVVSLIILLLVGWSSWGLLRQALRMGLLAVPDGIAETAVRDHLLGLAGVTAVHDLHIWAMSTTEAALSVHLVMPQGQPGDDFLNTVAHDLQHMFGIDHCTVQVERAAHGCATRCCQHTAA